MPRGKTSRKGRQSGGGKGRSRGGGRGSNLTQRDRQLGGEHSHQGSQNMASEWGADRDENGQFE